jgi:hypothetical protein
VARREQGPTYSRFAEITVIELEINTDRIRVGHTNMFRSSNSSKATKMLVHSLNSCRSRSVTKRYGLRSRQRGLADGYEGIFALIFIGIGLLFLIVYGVAIGLGKGPRGKLIGFFVATVLLSPIWFPVLKLGVEQKWWDITKSVSEESCYKELESIPEAFAIDSLVDETGGLRSSDIVHLLTKTKLRSIDIRLGLTLGITGYEDYFWRATQQQGFAHLELGDFSEANCFYSNGLDKDGFFTWHPPIKPGTCLKVSYLDRPAGKYVVRETRTGLGSRYSKWILQASDSDQTLASVTDAFRLPPYPQPVPYWDRRSERANNCRTGVGGYGLLLDRIRATKEAVETANNWVVTSANLVVNGTPQSTAQLKKIRDDGLLIPLHSTDKPFDGDHKALRETSNWAHSYEIASKQGAWMYGTALILPSTGKMFNVTNEGLAGLWGTTGSQLILVMAATNDSDKRAAIFGADFQGNLLWSAQTARLSPWTTSSELQFEPAKFELTDTNLLIHGIYGHSIGEENRKPWTISISLAELNSLENKGLSQIKQ